MSAPWDDPNGPRFIANELRQSHYVGITIAWPAPGPGGAGVRHVVTAWGDEGDSNQTDVNPATLTITDSDRDDGGDVQTYTYDAYDDPSHMFDEGPGWYFDYTPAVHPYIIQVVILSPTDESSERDATQTVVGSYEIYQDDPQNATGLHYDVGTDTEILSYKTVIDWTDQVDPTIVEHDPRKGLTVDWDLSSAPVPLGTSVKITTTFVLDRYNAIWYDDVRFSYDDPNDPIGIPKPGHHWIIDTPFLTDPSTWTPGQRGGYVYGAYDLYSDPNGTNLLGRCRLQHEYDFDQDPTVHHFTLSAPPGTPTVYVDGLRFGHSYSLLYDDALWALDPNDPNDWLTQVPGPIELSESTPIDVVLSWPQLLAYPCGSNYIEPGVCPGDANCDGSIDFGDINAFVDALLSGMYCDELGINADVNQNGWVGFDDINPFVELLTTQPIPIACP